jgi:D-aminopeptidase
LLWGVHESAAIGGARDAGATHILVNDSHGSHRNLLIEELHAPAELTSNNIKPMGMMAGLAAMRLRSSSLITPPSRSSPTTIWRATGSSASCTSCAARSLKG